MRVGPVRCLAFLPIVGLLIAAPASARPADQAISGNATPTQFSFLSAPSDASDYYEYRNHIRHGTASATFSYMEYSSDPSGYYQSYASGVFESVEDYDGQGTPGFWVYWYSYDASIGTYEYAYGYAPQSSVKSRGNELIVAFDGSALVGGWSWPETTAWKGTFSARDRGPFSSTRVFNGTDASTSESYYCRYESRTSGTTNQATADFVGTCGGVAVLAWPPNSSPNGSWLVFRGTGLRVWRCRY